MLARGRTREYIYIYKYRRERWRYRSKGKRCVFFPDKLITFSPPCCTLIIADDARRSRSIFGLGCKVQLWETVFSIHGPDGLRLVPSPSLSSSFLAPVIETCSLCFMGQESYTDTFSSSRAFLGLRSNVTITQRNEFYHDTFFFPLRLARRVEETYFFGRDVYLKRLDKHATRVPFLEPVRPSPLLYPHLVNRTTLSP